MCILREVEALRTCVTVTDVCISVCCGAFSSVLFVVSELCISHLCCSVLDLNAFERQIKAEGLGVAAEHSAGTSAQPETSQG